MVTCVVCHVTVVVKWWWSPLCVMLMTDMAIVATWHGLWGTVGVVLAKAGHGYRSTEVTCRYTHGNTCR
jgi:hypothetical protein